MSIDVEQLMETAIDAAHRGILAGQSPFGCAIAIDGTIVAACHNTVLLSTDITAHAEINTIREACRRTNNIFLPEAVVATTCEPCPMCMSALHWARVKHVYFGASIDDAATSGFNELTIPAHTILADGGSEVELHDGVLQERCQQLFQLWNEKSLGEAY